MKSALYFPSTPTRRREEKETQQAKARREPGNYACSLHKILEVVECAYKVSATTRNKVPMRYHFICRHPEGVSSSLEEGKLPQ